MSNTPKVPITTSLAAWAHNLPAGYNVVVHDEVHNSVLHPVRTELCKEHCLYLPSDRVLTRGFRFSDDNCFHTGNLRSTSNVLLLSDNYNLNELPAPRWGLQEFIVNHLDVKVHSVVIVTANPVVVKGMTDATLYRFCQGGDTSRFCRDDVSDEVRMVQPSNNRDWSDLSLDDIYETLIAAERGMYHNCISPPYNL